MPTLNELLHAASRTFAIGIDLLPEPLRTEVEVAYLLLRVSDYLEDNASMEPELKVRLLRCWAAVLAGETGVEALEASMCPVTDATPDAVVAASVVQVHRALESLPRAQGRRIVTAHVRDSTLGMARWVERGPRIVDEADLDDYMHEVAGRVGWLLTELFALELPEVRRSEEAMRVLGREFGLALQTVNVIRGLHSDWERGWVFVPRSFMGGEGGDPLRMFTRGERDMVLEAEILGRLARKAEAHLEAAERYIARLPRRRHGIRLFCLLPYLFAVRTLALSRHDPRVFVEEVKLSRPEVRRIARSARLLGWSNRWVRWYAEALSASPDASPRSRGPGG